jgi:UDP-2-acetamido-2-deoxy-ribo-hexuluronate aminotransferase
MIPFIDLKEQFRQLESDIRARIDRVLEHGNFILGPEVRELEEKLARFVGVRHCVSCSSGTDALLMPLMALGIGPGDAVFTSPFTFIATAEVISLLGATPVFVDIDPRTFNIDPGQLELAIRAVQERDASIYPLPSAANREPLAMHPKGVIPIDLFGLPADYDPITDIAERYGLFILEDAAQGLGGLYRDRAAGSLGHVGATSFFPAKPLGCYGDGGAIFTDDDAMAEKLASIRVHGKGGHKYDNVRTGINGRLDTMQAAILLAKLEVFPAEIEARQRVAALYTELLTSHSSLLTVPFVPPGMRSAWAQYSVLTDDREGVQACLKKEGIPTAVYYPKPLHLQTAFSSLDYRQGDFPVSERTAARIFSLPMHPYLQHQQVEAIANAFALMSHAK